MPTPGGSTARGYGYDHQRTRRALIASVIGKPCVRCGQPILEGQPVDLDHTDNRDGYLGFAHRSCNRAAGARKGNRNRQRRRATLTITSRDW